MTILVKKAQSIGGIAKDLPMTLEVGTVVWGLNTPAERRMCQGGDAVVLPAVGSLAPWLRDLLLAAAALPTGFVAVEVWGQQVLPGGPVITPQSLAAQ